MKKTLCSLFVITMLFGCSSNTSTEQSETNTESEKNTESKTQSENNQNEAKAETVKKEEQSADSMNEYQPNPQVTDDRSLQKVGQTHRDGKGEATLKAIKNINQTYKIGSVELTIKEMKSIHLRPDYSMIDYFHVLTHDEEFDFVKVFVEVKNTSSEKVNFAPVALFKTSTGETFDWQKDIYLEELNGELEGNETKSGNIGFIVNAAGGHEHEGEHGEEAHGEHHEDEKNNEAKETEWIEITTSDVFDQNQKKINDAQKIKLEF
ncbi:DUF4352 domain-containing protein [Priestia megaterium]|nr:DUF4352 domain-containing protein [Priestia megaterium]